MLNGPSPTREKGERNLDIPNYLTRIVPQWSTPEWYRAEIWRKIVRNQPVAMLCRETLIDNVLALDWKIQARDSNQRDELKPDIDYYTKFLENNGDYDYSEHVDWVLQDMLDIPFGAGTEVGREGDDPEGKVVWFDLLDGATLFPTLSQDEPVGQKIPELPVNPVYFPAHAINRAYLSPRTEIKRKGWGMAPPEKVYLSLEMLARGDRYYANLLLDTPEAGILDLGDMSKESAEDWLQAFRTLLYGIDPFKIPVIYEHTSETKWIPFGRPPSEMIYNQEMMKMAAIVAAGYGLSLSDIGMSSATNGGDTLAGTIRQERRTRKTGLSLVKRKLKAYFNRFLPSTLSFGFIDYDDELNVALGRARLASATAFGALIDKGVFAPQEARSQMIADGVMSISLPEKLPPDAKPAMPATGWGGSRVNTPERPGMLGSPVPPSGGGQGEIKSLSQADQSLEMTLKTSFNNLMANASDVRLRKLLRIAAKSLYPEVSEVVTELSKVTEIEKWRSWHNRVMFDEVKDVPEVITKSLEHVYNSLDQPLSEDDWWKVDFDEKAIISALSLAYLTSLKSSAQEMIDDLYENNLLPTPYIDPNMAFKLTNEAVMRELEQRGASMVKNVLDGTKYYLRRILVAAARDGLSEGDIIQKIKNGVGIDEILNDNSMMAKWTSQVQEELKQLAETRIKAIVTMEMRSAENSARLAQFKRVGLESKAWEHVGPDEPCDHCQKNESAGYVPLDFKFDSAFGPVDAPLAHPGGHCHLKYLRQELFQKMLGGNFGVWTGD